MSVSRRTTLFICFALLLNCIAEVRGNDTDFYSGSSVRSVTSSAAFDSILSNASPVLVEVFAPWCAACKSLKPSIIELASRLKGSVQIVAVDATLATNSEIVDRLDANSFPTFRFFPRGQQSVPLNFRASTDVDDMTLWLSNQIAPLWRSVSSLSALQESVDPRLVFAVFHGDVSVRDPISATADVMRQQVAFFETDQPAAFGMPEHASLALFTITFDDSPRVGVVPVAILDFSQPKSASELKQLISVNSIPLVDELNARNYLTYFSSTLPLLCVYTNESTLASPGSIWALRPQLTAIAAKYRGKIAIVHMNGVESRDHAQRVKLSGKQFPAAALITGLSIDAPDAEPTVYPLNETVPFTATLLQDSIETFLAGRLTPYRRSKRAPTATEISRAAPVELLVGSTFDSQIMHSDSDVLVEFYLSSCAACTLFEPEYREAALIMSPALRVFKMEVSGNGWDRNRFPVNAYPTVFLVTGAERRVHKAPDSVKSAADVLDFVRQHASSVTRQKLADAKSIQSEVESLSALALTLPAGEKHRLQLVLAAYRMQRAALSEAVKYKAEHDSHHHHHHDHDHHHHHHEHDHHEHEHDHHHHEHDHHHHEHDHHHEHAGHSHASCDGSSGKCSARAHDEL